MPTRSRPKLPLPTQHCASARIGGEASPPRLRRGQRAQRAGRDTHSPERKIPRPSPASAGQPRLALASPLPGGERGQGEGIETKRRPNAPSPGRFAADLSPKGEVELLA